jgi:hypothetical protein
MVADQESLEEIKAQLTLLSTKVGEVETKTDAIDKKLSEKWFLPVFIAVITASLGLATFFIQRSFSRGDVGENKRREIIGEEMGKAQLAFYTGCQAYLVDINERFESFCQFGGDQDRDSTVRNIIRLNNFCRKQKINDQHLIELMKEYTDFVGDNIIDVAPSADKKAASTIYVTSKSLYDKAATAISDGITTIQKP